ncbi:glycosyltransferase (plasmid) [Acuticoccus sp. MNP-M23]|uniref:glycosyltransferase n=1 Tax=Acuticoccus sp. MNP-M23 TaxID=3072793 RepID=UPI002814F216|nr:glycosyltransferase [Acuticoccus sp. MNP-M23]WMS45357.1 glycosyltransferase [Acuticoccus sp. MNP-M23]
MSTSPSGTDARQSVAILSSAPVGGAGIAARRLADALIAHTDLDVDFLDGAALGEFLPDDVAPKISYSNRIVSDVHFSVEFPGFARGWLVEMLKGYDLVNIHWASTILSLAEIDAVTRTGQPVAFTLHDFNYVSGGCHYPGPCERMATGCHACPQIDRTLAGLDVPPRLYRIKAGIFARENVHLTAPSHYVRDRAVASGIVPEARAHVVRNPYAPLEAPLVRGADAPLRLLLIADYLSERRKNMALALDALALLSRDGAPLVVDLVGHGDSAVRKLLDATGVPYVAHGRITDHAVITEVYRGADILLTASSEDNWPNILVEAGVYGGIPVVGPGHGCAEFVEAFGFGEIAADYSAKAFAAAIARAIDARTPAAVEAAIAQIREAHDPAAIAGTFAQMFASPRAVRGV